MPGKVSPPKDLPEFSVFALIVVFVVALVCSGSAVAIQVFNMVNP